MLQFWVVYEQCKIAQIPVAAIKMLIAPNNNSNSRPYKSRHNRKLLIRNSQTSQQKIVIKKHAIRRCRYSSCCLFSYPALLTAILKNLLIRITCFVHKQKLKQNYGSRRRARPPPWKWVNNSTQTVPVQSINLPVLDSWTLEGRQPAQSFYQTCVGRWP